MESAAVLGRDTPVGLVRRGLRYGRILLGARTGRWAFSGPLYVQLGPSSSCNFRCVMCWDHGPGAAGDDRLRQRAEDSHAAAATTSMSAGRRNGLFEFDRLPGLLDDLLNMGTRRIKLTGRGEPLLHPQWREMIALVKRKGMRCTLTTNGSLLEEGDAELLAGLGLDEIEISLNAATEATYAEIHARGGAEGFHRILSWVRRLADAKRAKRSRHPRAILSFVVLKNNYAEIAELPAVAERYGFEQIALRRVSFPEGARAYMLDREDVVHLQQVLARTIERCAGKPLAHNCGEILRWGPSLTHRSPEEHNLLLATPCYVGWYFCQIQADGSVYPCCQCTRPIATLEEAPLSTIWRAPPYRAFRRHTFRDDAWKRREADCGCLCSECGFLRHNLSIDRVLRWRRFRAATPPAVWSLRDLERF